MATGDGNYITIAEIQQDFALSDKISKASYPTTSIAVDIGEAENYIESALIPIGYTRSDLQSAPLVKSLCYLYCRYAVLRNIFTNISPSEVDKTVYEKWLDQLNEKIKELISPKNPLAQLTDSNGDIIPKSGKDRRFIIETTTPNVKRAITMDEDYTWDIDTDTYADEDVVGEK